MYKAIISRIYIHEHPNADRLALGNCHGFQVVVSKDTPDGAIGIFFPCDGQLSDEYCQANNLYPIYDETGNRIGGGFIDQKNRRVRAQNFRGCVSEGLWMPISSLIYIKNLPKLEEGIEFCQIAGHEICNKYINPATKKAISNKHKTKQNLRETLWLNTHPDTPQLKYTINNIRTGDLISITEKVHGTCLTYNTRVRMYDGSIKSMNKIQKGDIVLGHNADTNVLEPSEVLDVMKYLPADSQWLKVYIGEEHTKDTYVNLLNCTKEHRVWTENRGWVEAQHLTKEDTLLSSVQYPIINDVGKQVLIGKMLGDGYIDRHATAWSVAFSHSSKQEEYLRYCHYILGNFATDTINTAISGYGSDMYRARTKQTPQITELFKDWFSGTSERKEIPTNFELSPISLAFWYMDDGSLTHSESQKDRATFAVCGFSETSVNNLIEAFSKLGIEAVSYQDSEDYWRIRLNTKAAYIMFNLIATYIPPSMKYKLPEEMRDESYIDLSYLIDTDYMHYTKPLYVRSIELDKEQHYRYDITTTTSNFIANNVLVHNSQRSGWSWESEWVPFYPFLKPLLRFKWLRKYIAQEHFLYKFLNGTRRVLVESFSTRKTKGYYRNEEFRFKHEEHLKHVLPVGFQIYYEVVGYEDENKLIMPEVSNFKHSKEFATAHGKTTRFTYGCKPGESKMLVYAMQYTSPVGQKIQFPYLYMKRFCDKWGLECVPLLDMFVFESETDLLDRVDTHTDGLSVIDPSHIREGVCLEVVKPTMEVSWVKNKSRDFYILEDVIKSDESVVDMEELESYDM